jgi:hypothetical protein
MKSLPQLGVRDWRWKELCLTASYSFSGLSYARKTDARRTFGSRSRSSGFVLLVARDVLQDQGARKTRSVFGGIAVRRTTSRFRRRSHS